MAAGELAHEWSGRIEAIEQLAKQVSNQGYSPLSSTRRTAMLHRLESKPVFLLGSTTVYARYFLAAAQQMFDVRAVVDDQCRDSQIEGVPRISSAEFLNQAPGSIAICLAFSRNGKNHFESLAATAGAELFHYMEAADSIPGFKQDHILEGLARETALHVEQLVTAATRFEDAISIQTLLCILTARLTYQREWLESVNAGPESMYFGLDFMQLDRGEAVVDCGAFDGDTIEKVRDATADRFKSIIALEPDPQNFSVLQEKYSRDDRIALHCLGASNRSASRAFEATQGSFSHFRYVSESRGSQSTIATTTLDSLIQQPPTTIKIDIEGAELEALEGARETIQQYRPKMTLAAYHRPLHLAEIMDSIDQTVTGYRFYLRHHGDFFLETVLYAIPPVN
jgi:FkbM family methyltransferase